MTRLATDEEGIASIEAGIVLLASLTMFLIFIIFVPLGWLRIQAVDRSASSLAEITAREPLWSQAALNGLAVRLAPRLIKAADPSVSIAIARIERSDERAPRALVCIGTETQGGQATALEEDSVIEVDAALLSTGNSIIVVRVEADIELFSLGPTMGSIMATTARFSRAATARPVAGAIRYVGSSNRRIDIPKICGG